MFRLTPAGVETVLHSFTQGSDGAYPLAALIQGKDGNFYGTTYEGGPSTNCNLGCGTVFRVTPAGVETVLHSFDGTDGAFPSAPLLQANDGDFYGTASAGGMSNTGTVFKIVVVK